MITGTDIDTAAKTVWGEARGEGDLGMLAVACVLVNRWRKGRPGRDGSLMEVCLRKYQFSCWLENDPNLPKMQALTWDDELYRQAVIAVLRAIKLAGTDEDPSNSATHYHTLDIKPNWADPAKETATIHHHRFYAGIA